MLSQFLYDTGIRLYTAAIRVAALRNTKAQQWVQGREGWQAKVKKALAQHKGEQLAWFHCASLGEFEQGRPVIEAFKTAFPEHKVMLTFFSPSGYEIRKNYAQADYVFYLPPDTAANAQEWIYLTEPSVVFFVKYEFWNYYLRELKHHNIPTVSFSAIFRNSQVFFKGYGNFYREILACFDQIFVQNQASVELVESIGLRNAVIGGDTRFDRVADLVNNPRAIPIAQKFKNQQQLLIVGSAWPQDMDVILPVLNKMANRPKVMVVPHEIDFEHIETWRSTFGGKSICFSEAEEETVNQYDMLIIDNVGMLSVLYQYADVAWIGGAYGKGLHTTLEAATFGMPIFFGNKNYKKFQEANDLIAAEVAVPIANATDFQQPLEKLMASASARDEIKQKSKEYVRSKVGATAKVIHWYHDYLLQKKS